MAAAILERVFERVPGRSARLLATAAALPPGPAAMRLLSQVDPRELRRDEREALVDAWERCRRWLAAEQSRASEPAR